jgi:hypothetical protein
MKIKHFPNNESTSFKNTTKAHRLCQPFLSSSDIMASNINPHNKLQSKILPVICKIRIETKFSAIPKIMLCSAKLINVYFKLFYKHIKKEMLHLFSKCSA